jgi:transcriptional regulator with XRE-family HTH domain
MYTLLGFPDGGVATPFGRMLRRWRDARRKSQLTLATESGISTRHLSFLETGRAQPSREMVQLLAGMLDVPLGDRNALLVSAGYAPVYGERPLSAPELEPVRRALQFTLRQQEPFPALVVDGEWNIVMKNEGAHRVFELFSAPDCDDDGRVVDGRVNVMRTVFHPKGLRRYIVNWEQLAECLVHSLHRQVADTGSDAMARLRDELLSYPGVPSRWSVADPAAAMPPVVSMHLRKDDLSLTFFSTITTLGTPRDVTLQQLKIECFFPADAVTEQTARHLASPSSALRLA